MRVFRLGLMGEQDQHLGGDLVRVDQGQNLHTTLLQLTQPHICNLDLFQFVLACHDTCPLQQFYCPLPG